MERQKQSGINTNEAIRSAVLQAIPNSIIEVSGGTEKLVSKLTEKTKGLTGDLFQSALEEGLEEVLQYPVEGFVKKTTYAPDTPLFSLDESAVINPKEMAENFATGAAVGGILGGASIGTQNGINSIVDRQAAKAQERSEAAGKIAEQMVNGLDMPQATETAGIINATTVLPETETKTAPKYSIRTDETGKNM